MWIQSEFPFICVWVDLWLKFSPLRRTLLQTAPMSRVTECHTQHPSLWSRSSFLLPPQCLWTRLCPQRPWSSTTRGRASAPSPSTHSADTMCASPQTARWQCGWERSTATVMCSRLGPSHPIRRLCSRSWAWTDPSSEVWGLGWQRATQPPSPPAVCQMMRTCCWTAQSTGWSTRMFAATPKSVMNSALPLPEKVGWEFRNWYLCFFFFFLSFFKFVLAEFRTHCSSICVCVSITLIESLVFCQHLTKIFLLSYYINMYIQYISFSNPVVTVSILSPVGGDDHHGCRNLDPRSAENWVVRGPFF